MARLPIPGSDDGTWGSILNSFLDVAHNSNGTLKSTGIIATKADDSAVVHNTGNETIAGVKTFSSSPVVPAPTGSTDVANKSYVDSVGSAGASNATISAPGLVQLAGDLGGTSTSATAPTLAATTNVTNIINANTKVAGALQTSNNLSDLASTTTARTNLGLGNVDNTSDATKNSATATLTNKTISGSSNTLSNIPESAVTNLSTDLAATEKTANKGVANGYASLNSSTLVPTAQLGSGTASGTTFLRGDGSWQTPSGAAGALLASNNLSDVASVSTSRSNLGLGSAATENTSAFDAAGAAATAQSNAEAASLPIAGGTMQGWLAPASGALTGSTTTAVNASTGNDFTLTLISSSWKLSNPTNVKNWQVIRFHLAQGSGGNFTIAYDTDYNFGALGQPTLSSAAGDVDIVAFQYDPNLALWCYLGSALGFSA